MQQVQQSNIAQSKSPLITQKLQGYLEKLVKNEISRSEAQLRFLKYKKYGGEIAQEIQKAFEDPELQKLQNISEVQHLAHFLFTEEKEVLAPYLREILVVRKIVSRIKKLVTRQTTREEVLIAILKHKRFGAKIAQELFRLLDDKEVKKSPGYSDLLIMSEQLGRVDKEAFEVLKVIAKVQDNITKMILNGFPRDAVSEQIRSEPKKYWSEIAKKIYKQKINVQNNRLTEDDDLREQVSFPEILNLVDLLCKMEKEDFVPLFEEHINTIFKRVYRSVKKRDGNTSPLRIMRKSWFGLFSEEKLKLIQRTIKTVLKEDIDVFTQEELQNLHNYYLQRNVKGFEQFLYNKQLEEEPPKLKKIKTEQKKSVKQPTAAPTKKVEQEKKVEKIQKPQNNQQPPYFQFPQPTQALQMDRIVYQQQYNYKQIWQPVCKSLFLDLFANNSLLSIRDNFSEINLNREYIQGFIKNKPNETPVVKVQEIFQSYHFRCGLCMMRFNNEARYIDHIDRHAKERIQQLTKSKSDLKDMSLSNERQNLPDPNNVSLSKEYQDWLNNREAKLGNMNTKDQEIFCSIPYDALKQSSCGICTQRFQGIWENGVMVTQNVVNVRVLDSFHNEQSLSLHLDCFKALQSQEQPMSFNINHHPQQYFTQYLYSDGRQRE